MRIPCGYYQKLADLETAGEVAAIRDAGLREYQVNPDAHEPAPALR